MGKIEQRLLIAGNWKMHKGVKEAMEFARELRTRLGEVNGREVVVFPPFTSLPAVAEVLKGSAVAYGAQNVFWEKSGAFTGEISPVFLTELGCRYVLIGHSERRRLLGETDEMCSRKMRAALENGLRPILCCGETLVERNQGKTLTVLAVQLAGGLARVPTPAGFDIAYEPVWAIGTGVNATPEQVQEVHRWIRHWLVERGLAEGVRIVYGGSVKPDNIGAILSQPDVAGVLVGGASLEVTAFIQIVNSQVRKPGGDVCS